MDNNKFGLKYNNSFDFAEAIKAADTFAKSTGVTCRVVDSVGETVHISSVSEKQIAVCNLTAKYFYCGSGDCAGKETMANICLNSHLYGCYQSERFGGRYIFFCPLGLTNWTAPIIIDETVEGAFLAGPVNMVAPDEFLVEDFLEKYGLTHTAAKEIEAVIKDVPVIETGMVNHYSELLYYMAKAVSDSTFSIIEARKAQGEQQAEIAEQIKFLKSFSPNNEYDPYPMEKEEELLDLIETGDKAGSQRVLNEILGHIFFSSGGSFEVIRSRVLELVVLLSRAAIKGGADTQQIFGLNYTYLGRINSFRNIEELTYWLSGIMTRFTDQVFNLTDVKHVDVIYRAIDYVRKNFDRRITLEETAANVYLSPAYFSRVFKEETGDNFNLYVNKIRIETSKKLLLNENIPLVDISTMVGFDGQSYFSKVFKKMTGTTPGKYRESRGKIKLTEKHKKNQAITRAKTKAK